MIWSIIFSMCGISLLPIVIAISFNLLIASILPFIENFLSTLYMCYKELDKRFSIVNSNKITKKARIEATVLNNLTPI